ncbi:hypothetical protein KIPB_004546, partial [Kipferlia bialata]
VMRPKAFTESEAGRGIIKKTQSVRQGELAPALRFGHESTLRAIRQSPWGVIRARFDGDHLPIPGGLRSGRSSLPRLPSRPVSVSPERVGRAVEGAGQGSHHSISARESLSASLPPLPLAYSSTTATLASDSSLSVLHPLGRWAADPVAGVETEPIPLLSTSRPQDVDLRRHGNYSAPAGSHPMDTPFDTSSGTIQDSSLTVDDTHYKMDISTSFGTTIGSTIGSSLSAMDAAGVGSSSQLQLASEYMRSVSRKSLRLDANRTVSTVRRTYAAGLALSGVRRAYSSSASLLSPSVVPRDSAPSSPRRSNPVSPRRSNPVSPRSWAVSSAFGESASPERDHAPPAPSKCVCEEDTGESQDSIVAAVAQWEGGDKKGSGLSPRLPTEPAQPNSAGDTPPDSSFESLGTSFGSLVLSGPTYTDLNDVDSETPSQLSGVSMLSMVHSKQDSVTPSTPLSSMEAMSSCVTLPITYQRAEGAEGMSLHNMSRLAMGGGTGAGAIYSDASDNTYTSKISVSDSSMTRTIDTVSHSIGMGYPRTSSTQSHTTTHSVSDKHESSAVADRERERQVLDDHADCLIDEDSDSSSSQADAAGDAEPPTFPLQQQPASDIPRGLALETIQEVTEPHGGPRRMSRSTGYLASFTTTCGTDSSAVSRGTPVFSRSGGLIPTMSCMSGSDVTMGSTNPTKHVREVPSLSNQSFSIPGLESRSHVLRRARDPSDTLPLDSSVQSSMSLTRFVSDSLKSARGPRSSSTSTDPALPTITERDTDGSTAVDDSPRGHRHRSRSDQSESGPSTTTVWPRLYPRETPAAVTPQVERDRDGSSDGDVLVDTGLDITSGLSSVSGSLPHAASGLDARLLDDLEALHRCVPVGSALSNMADVYCADIQPGSKVDTTAGDSSPESSNNHVASRFRSLLELVQSMSQLFKMCLSPTYKSNLFVTLHTISQLERFHVATMVLGLLELVAGYLWCRPVRRTMLRSVSEVPTAVYRLGKVASTYFLPGVLIVRSVYHVAAGSMSRRFLFRLLRDVLLRPRDGKRRGGLRRRVDRAVFMFRLHIAVKTLLQTLAISGIFICVYCAQHTFLDGLEDSGGDFRRHVLTSWGSVPFIVVESALTLFTLPFYAAVPINLLSIFLCAVASAQALTMSSETYILYLSVLLAVLLCILQAVTKAVTLVVGTRLVVQSTAAKVLVSRVMSGQFFNRILTPFMAHTASSGVSFGYMRPGDARAMLRELKQHHLVAGMETGSVLPMVYAQIVHMAGEPLVSQSKGYTMGVTEVDDAPTPSTGADVCESLPAVPEGAGEASACSCPPRCLCRTNPNTARFVNAVYNSLHIGAPVSVRAVPIAPVRVKEAEICTLFNEWYPGLFSHSPKGTDVDKGAVIATSAKGRETPLGEVKHCSQRAQRESYPVCPVGALRDGPPLVREREMPEEDSCGDVNASVSPGAEGLPPLPASVCHPTPTPLPEAGPLVSQEEWRIMQETETQFFPLMIYTKLDIVGFTQYCSEHGSDVVHLLSILFTSFDRIVARYQTEGVAKVKTIGDAYEIMRPVTPEELYSSSVADLQAAVASSVQCSHELVECALAIFSSMQVSLQVRCGTAIGPAFGAVIGRLRVSYDIFGLAPARARVMESLSPIGCVTVCNNIFQLLRLHKVFVFGDSLSKNLSGGSYAQAFLAKTQELLDREYEAVAPYAPAPPCSWMGVDASVKGDRSAPARLPSHLYEAMYLKGEAHHLAIVTRHVPIHPVCSVSARVSGSGGRAPHTHVMEGGKEDVSPEGVILLGIAEH